VPFETGDYYAKVLLNARDGSQHLTSPGLSKEAAERDLVTIHEFEGRMDPLKLD
jgi:hypothetical protein